MSLLLGCFSFHIFEKFINTLWFQVSRYRYLRAITEPTLYIPELPAKDPKMLYKKDGTPKLRMYLKIFSGILRWCICAGLATHKYKVPGKIQFHFDVHTELLCRKSSYNCGGASGSGILC